MKKNKSMDVNYICDLSELHSIINSLDLYSRIMIGQYNHIVDEYMWYLPKEKRINRNDLDYIEHLLYSIRSCFIPSLDSDPRKSLGIWGYDTPEEAIRAYDIQQVLRYQLAWHEYPEGGYTANFYEPYIHGEWDMSLEDKNEIKTILKKYNYKDYKNTNKFWNCPVIIVDFTDKLGKILMSNQVLKVIEDALEIKQCISNKKMGDVFKKIYPNISYEIYKSTIQKIEAVLNE